jgi:diaminohydroxyphosphoribosylaminopyrimidine deaminase/5-amino-6-(5-phosphoribosylamino)uracil reductase
MARALELARQGIGWCSPNPPVGAVIVADGEIIGEGFHAKAGGPHAEVAAIASVDGSCKGAVLYVTLEPCNHHGRTPPCCDAVISAGIAEVVIGTVDPNPAVAGGGIDRLRSTGTSVSTGVLEPEALELIRMFSWHAKTERPYVVAKYGASLDGKVATRGGQSQWITGHSSRTRVHELRHALDAILVGVNTVIADDPLLNARRTEASANPRPVVLDSTGRIPLSAKLVQAAKENNLIVATTDAMSRSTQRSLESAGCDVWRMPATGDGRVDLHSLVTRLGSIRLQSLLVEGGASTLGSFFDAGLVN